MTCDADEYPVELVALLGREAVDPNAGLSVGAAVARASSSVPLVVV